MSNKRESVDDNQTSNSEGTKIVAAIRFLDEIGEQVNAVRSTIKEQIKRSRMLDELKIDVHNFKDDFVETETGYALRSYIDTFEIYDKPKGNKKPPVIYGAYQVSLAPVQNSEEGNFFPYLAVLLSSDPKQKYGGTKWDCEKFRLDEKYLEDDERWIGDPWCRRSGDDRYWESAKGNPRVAFVVPLVDLHNDKDTRNQIIDPLFEEIKKLLKGRD